MENIVYKNKKINKYLCLGLLMLSLFSCVNESSISNSNNEDINHIANNEILENVTYSLNKGEYYINNLAKLSTINDVNYMSTKIPVDGKDRYILSFELSDTSILGFAITNKYNTVIKDFYPYTKNGTFASLTKYIDVEIMCPEDASTLYINSKASFTSFSIKKCIIENKDISLLNNIEKKEFKVGANNIGEFDYGDSTYSNEQYKEHWNNMLNSNEYDLFVFEDCVDSYIDGSSTQSVLGNKKSKWLGIESFGSYLHASSDFEPVSQNLILLPYSMKNKATRRYIAYKTVYLINGKLTAFYTVHLIAEDHISIKDENGINYVSRRLRQEQFKTLIENSKYYDEACFLGDFNANEISEYNYFVENGFSIANGSDEFGNNNTLIRGEKELLEGKKDIPADNIIVSKGLKIDSFKILSGFNLNTDHLPVYGVISFEGEN